jgi:glutamate racemase
LNSRPIGVYDSGVGGLTVVREISSKLPWERVVYFGDTARVPYGEKTAQELLGFSREIIEFLIDKGSKYIIAACNTTSSQVLEDVKKEFDVPVIGVLRPGAYAASRATRTGRIGVMATAGTIRSGAYEKAIKEYVPWAAFCRKAGSSRSSSSFRLDMKTTSTRHAGHLASRITMRSFLSRAPRSTCPI